MSIFPSDASEVQADEWKYDSLGGWLILIAVGLCLSPLLQLVFIGTNLLPVFTKGAWAVLTTPGSPAYHPLWAPVIGLELTMNVAFIAMEGALLFWLFRRDYRFPKAMIAYLFIAFALVAGDYFLARQIPFVAAHDDQASRSTFVRAGLLCAIWVPYFLRSKRVRGTFVTGRAR